MPYDLLIIGAGQAAAPLAGACAAAGHSVAIAERAHLGGSCINFGCTPTKAAIASARAASQARRAREYGLHIPEVVVDFPGVLGRARGIAEAMRKSLGQSLEETPNLDLLEGHARLTGRDRSGIHAEVAGRSITARQVVLDTGTRSMIPPVDGAEAVEALHSENWLDRPELPDRLAVIGGSYIGLEMAQFYARMGSRVTIVETGPQLAGQEDEDIARALGDLLAREGIEFRLDARLSGIKKTDAGGMSLVLSGKDGNGGPPPELAASHLFFATGRNPNTGDLGLDRVGVELDQRGFVVVDERLATTAPGIWAAGDIRGSPMFTHTSWDDARILQSQLLGDGSRTTARLVPYAVFTDPQLGRVGLTERQARDTGRRFRTSRFSLAANGKAKEIGEPDGQVKLLTGEEDGAILGAAVLAPEGAELVHIFALAMAAGAPAGVLADAICIHPTLAEALQSAATA